MTRIWIEFDQLDALKDRLAQMVWWQIHAFRQDILIKIGYNRDKMNDTELLNMIREECLKSYNPDKKITMGIKSLHEATEEEKKACDSWAEQIIGILKDKGDVR